MSEFPKFFAMIITSTIVTFGLKYFNTYEFRSHLLQRNTRLHGARAWCDHGSVHAGHVNRAANAAILIGSVVVFASALWLLRSQATR